MTGLPLHGMVVKSMGEISFSDDDMGVPVSFEKMLNNFIDKNFKEICTPRYDKIQKFDDEGFLLVRYSDKWGIVDKNGKELIPPRYKQIYKCSGTGLIIGWIDGKDEGYVGLDGNEYWEGGSSSAPKK